MTCAAKAPVCLCLPASARAEVVCRARAEGTSFDRVVATAGAGKLAAMDTAAFFAERRRLGSEPPAGDVVA